MSAPSIANPYLHSLSLFRFPGTKEASKILFRTPESASGPSQPQGSVLLLPPHPAVLPQPSSPPAPVDGNSSAARDILNQLSFGLDCISCEADVDAALAAVAAGAEVRCLLTQLPFCGCWANLCFLSRFLIGLSAPGNIQGNNCSATDAVLEVLLMPRICAAALFLQF